MQRRRFKHILSFPERLDQEAERLRAEAEKLPQGTERDELLRKARQAETASHVNETLLIGLVGLVLVISLTILLIHFGARDQRKRQLER